MAEQDQNPTAAYEAAPDAASVEQTPAAPPRETPAHLPMEMPSAELLREYAEEGATPEEDPEESSSAFASHDHSEEWESTSEDDLSELFFDPILPAGAEGTQESDEGSAFGYSPPARPEWLDTVPDEARAQAESLFNGMAKLHRETAGHRALETALKDPDRSVDAMFAQIERVAERFDLTPQEYLGLMLDDGSSYDSDLSEGDDPYAGHPYAGDFDGDDFDRDAFDGDDSEEEVSYEVDPYEDEIAAQAKSLLEADPDYVAFKQEREQAKLDAHRRAFIESQGKTLAPQISARLDGFEVTPEMVCTAREYAYLRYDDEAFHDPVLAVETRFRNELRAFRNGLSTRPGRAKAPTMTRSAGSSPANPGYEPTLADARRFLADNPDY